MRCFMMSYVDEDELNGVKENMNESNIQKCRGYHHLICSCRSGKLIGLLSC